MGFTFPFSSTLQRAAILMAVIEGSFAVTVKLSSVVSSVTGPLSREMVKSGTAVTIAGSDCARTVPLCKRKATILLSFTSRFWGAREIFPLEKLNLEPTRVPPWVVKEVSFASYCFTRRTQPSGMLPLTSTSRLVSVVFTVPFMDTAGLPMTGTESSGIWKLGS